jgi:glucose-6-phosphate isomerase
MPSEIVVAMDIQAVANTSRHSGFKGSEEEVLLNQDALICSMFAHVDELAFGVDKQPTLFPPGTNPTITHEESFGSTRGVGDRELTCDGNRPCNLLMCGKLDAFACGQLIALSEHRAAVKAKLWGMDPFVREVGASIRSLRTDKMKEELQKLQGQLATAGASEEIDEDKEGANLSTTTLLRHYASRVREQRKHSHAAKRPGAVEEAFHSHSKVKAHSRILCAVGIDKVATR